MSSNSDTVAARRDPSLNQLVNYAATAKEGNIITTDHGAPEGFEDTAETVGPEGPILLEDYYFLEKIAHFDRERIPERAAHAVGGGAFGYFEVTDDITQYTAAKVFSQVGKRTAMAVRFSLVAPDRGGSTVIRDVRGFALKFYTEDGIWDLVGNNLPVFFIRDATRFPSFIHAQKRNPATNVFRDPDMFWDFFSLVPESVHLVLYLFSDLGIPDGWRHMHGYGVNTFSFINSDGKIHWVRFQYNSDQGIKNLTQEQSDYLSGVNPDYSTRDLYDAIARGDFPSWTLYVQLLTPEEAANSKINIFDDTKVWDGVPLKRVGKFVLNKNATNYFAEIEQLAFCPAHLVPGIGASYDRMLQGRLFSYDDTQRYRVGPNSSQLPVNSPFRFRNYQRDGPMCLQNQGGAPNYYPNSFNGPIDSIYAQKFKVRTALNASAGYYNNQDQDNYSQPGQLVRSWTEDQQKQCAQNIASLLGSANGAIQNRMVAQFRKVDEGFGDLVEKALKNRTAAHV